MKRETGASPVRTRRCNKRVYYTCHCSKDFKKESKHEWEGVMHADLKVRRPAWN